MSSTLNQAGPALSAASAFLSDRFLEISSVFVLGSGAKPMAAIRVRSASLPAPAPESDQDRNRTLHDHCWIVNGRDVPIVSGWTRVDGAPDLAVRPYHSFVTEYGPQVFEVAAGGFSGNITDLFAIFNRQAMVHLMTHRPDDEHSNFGRNSGSVNQAANMSVLACIVAFVSSSHCTSGAGNLESIASLFAVCTKPAIWTPFVQLREHARRYADAQTSSQPCEANVYAVWDRSPPSCGGRVNVAHPQDRPSSDGGFDAVSDSGLARSPPSCGGRVNVARPQDQPSYDGGFNAVADSDQAVYGEPRAVTKSIADGVTDNTVSDGIRVATCRPGAMAKIASSGITTQADPERVLGIPYLASIDTPASTRSASLTCVGVDGPKATSLPCVDQPKANECKIRAPYQGNKTMSRTKIGVICPKTMTDQPARGTPPTACPPGPSAVIAVPKRQPARRRAAISIGSIRIGTIKVNTLSVNRLSISNLDVEDDSE